MKILPLAFQSGDTLLAELDPEHYITQRGRVVAKLTADSLWAKPVLPIVPTESLSLGDGEFMQLTAPWRAMQEYQKTGVLKHLPGQHDQSTHAGKRSYKSIDDLVKDGLDIQETVDELGAYSAADGNVAMRVLLERMGKNGTPEIVSSVDDLDSEPMYRGAADVTNESFKTNQYDRYGTGQYGDGYYFANDVEVAQDYANRAEADRTYGANKGDVMTAGWKKDAKVKRVTDGWDEGETRWSTLAINAQNKAVDKLNINTRASDSEDAIFNMFYSDYGNSLVTDLILDGFDGMQIDFDNGQKFTLVFNREALQVVSN